MNKYLPGKPIIENEHFTIYGNSGLEPIKEEMLNILTKERDKLLKIFDFNDFSKVTIHLFNNQNDYLNYHSRLSPYSKAMFGENTIYKIYEPKDIQIGRYWLISGLIHELVHILYLSIWQNNYDRVVWLDEGLAKYLSGQFSLLQKDESAKMQ